MVQRVKDLALSQIWHRFDPWLWNFLVSQTWLKEKKKKGKRKKKNSVEESVVGFR